MSQTFNDFKITQKGIFNYDTGVFLSFDRFQTKKGEWSVALKKRLGMMDNEDLNKFSNVYSKVYGTDASVVAQELYDITPKFKTQKKTIFVDGKFYKSRTFKPANYVKVGDNKYKDVLEGLVMDNGDNYVDAKQATNNLIENLKKLNLGTKLEVTIDLVLFSQKQIFKLLKTNMIDKKVVASTDGGQTWITLNERTMKKILEQSASSVVTGVGSEASYTLSGDMNREMIVKVSEYNETYANSNQPMGIVGGEFFRFHHKINGLDLKYLGIFNVNEINKDYHTYLNDNCLYYALKESGVEQDKLELMKTFVNNRNVPISALEKVCKVLEIRIKLIRLKGCKKKLDKFVDNTETTTYGTEGIECNLGLLDTHFFINKDSGVQRYALENCFDIIKDDKKDWTKICEKRSTGTYKYKNDRTIDTFLLVKTLFQHRDKYLANIEWTDEMINTQYIDKVDTFGSLEFNDTNTKPNQPSQKEIAYYTDTYSKELEQLYIVKVELEELSIIDVEEIFVDCTKEEIEFIFYNHTYFRPNKNEYYKIGFDFETYADAKDNYIHKPYLARYETEDGIKAVFRGKDCARQMLDNLPRDHENIMLIAHNCGYDYKFLFPYISSIKNTIMKGSSLMSVSCEYYKKKVSYVNNGGYKENGQRNIEKKTKLDMTWNIKLKDSYNLIPEPLRKFGKMFKLETSKEIIPYKLYNKVFSKYGVSKIWYKEEFVYKHVVAECGRKNLQQFKDNCIKWDCIVNGEINIMEYSNKYCEIDCEVMMKGYSIFREWIIQLGNDSKEKIDIDIDDVISVASLAHKYLVSQGCYEGIYQLSGKPREFIQKCVVGGRTMTNSNKKWKVNGGKLADFDACSLYPSAIYQMDGFLMGKPNIIKNTDLQTCLNHDGLFARCVITDLKIKRQFPLGSYMTEDGTRNFSNDLIGKELYLDKQSILDLQEFQQVDLKIIDGYYYDSGRNPKCKSVIRYLYDTRRQKKTEGNPIQAVYKLIMNSAYGKTILKPITDDTEIVSKFKYNSKTKKFEDNWKTYLGKQYNYIKEFTETKKVMIVKKHKSILDHFNNAHIGVEVLSKSKNIMNKVMCMGEDLKLKMYTQDTDSIHIDYDEVAILEEHYNKKYGTKLIGNDMGQFHIDFDLDGSVGDIWATDSIFLGKKSYIDKLESRDKDGNAIYGYHIRMKGITSASIDYTAKLNSKDNELDYMGLYNKLFDGQTINFDLLCGGEKDMFKSGKDMTIRTLKCGEFDRNVKFKYEIGVF
jgi:hypothetical protein